MVLKITEARCLGLQQHRHYHSAWKQGRVEGGREGCYWRPNRLVLLSFADAVADHLPPVYISLRALTQCAMTGEWREMTSVM